MAYRVGRFAPTPSGPLHLGSLLTALGSWLSARAQGGRWLLRFDDLDTPRVRPDAEAAILRQLQAHGLHWDGQPRRQSAHLDSYARALASLQRAGLTYACTCSRAQLLLTADASADEPVYPGTCRFARHPAEGAALRLRVPAEPLTVEDLGRGALVRQLDREIGDFVVRRRDGQFAYQLACAVDEAEQGITEVVRGADLIPSTFRQVHLMGLLDLPAPTYRHLPLVMGADGRKLSKQNDAAPLESGQATRNLREALRRLGQPQPPESLTEPAALLSYAVGQWDPQRIPDGVAEAP